MSRRILSREYYTHGIDGSVSVAGIMLTCFSSEQFTCGKFIIIHCRVDQISKIQSFILVDFGYVHLGSHRAGIIEGHSLIRIYPLQGPSPELPAFEDVEQPQHQVSFTICKGFDRVTIISLTLFTSLLKLDGVEDSRGAA